MSKVSDIVTQNIIKKLEEGVIPWQKPWAGGSRPINGISQKPYRGGNAFFLGLMPYGSNQWATFKQWASKGAVVRKGEKGTPIIFFTELEKSDGTKQPCLRFYQVFNREQIEGLESEPQEAPQGAREKPDIESLVQRMPQKPDIRHGGHSAHYSVTGDYVQMPEMGQFFSTEGYYSTLFHELGHATGAKHRLNRFKDKEPLTFHRRGESYAKEELVAELCAAILCQETGIENTIENSASYCASWLKALKNDTQMIISAASQAEKAASFIKGEQT